MKHELTRFLLVGLFILTTGILGERSQADTPKKNPLHRESTNYVFTPHTRGD